MGTKNCVFIGGKQIGSNCLKALVERGIRPTLVVANLDDNGEDKSWHESLIKNAQERNLEIVRDTKVRDPELIEKIRALNPEIIFCIGGTQIIPKEVLDIPKLGTLNIHPALLPKYRGRFSTAHAIFNGDTFTGVTVHWMDEGLDTGPIIFQEKFDIETSDTARTLYDKFTATGTKLFADFLNLWLSDQEIVSHAQDESQATYYPKGLPGDGEIDWNWSGEQIRNWIRAMSFTPFPPPSIMIGDKKFVIAEEQFFKGND